MRCAYGEVIQNIPVDLDLLELDRHTDWKMEMKFEPRMKSNGSG